MPRLLDALCRFESLALLAALACTPSLLGCGSGSGGTQDAAVVDTGVATDASGGDTGTSTQDGGVSPVCPAVAPSALDACTQEDLTCSYGQDLDPRCRAYFTCVGGAFQERPRADHCDAPPSLSCPGAVPAPGATCTVGDVGVTCEYESASTVCECKDVRCGGACQLLDPPQWICAGPPSTPGCPAVSPNYGDACSDDGLECRYLGGGCQGGSTLRCTNGYFQTVFEICPL
jgi:hypothetical protein